MRSMTVDRRRSPAGVSSSTFTRRSRQRLHAGQASRFEPIDETGHIRCIARQSLGKFTHRNRPTRFNQMQHVTLRRRQLKLRRQRRKIRPLAEEKFHQKLPGFACLDFVIS